MQPLIAGDPQEISGYELKGRLGAGGMGVVYLSYTRGGQAVALKVVRREYADDPEFRRRFAQEVRAARRVQGAYAVPVLDSDTDCTQPWLASAYVPGPALSEAVRTHGVLPPGTVLSLVAGIAEALATIHAAGVVHRDLKPTNVLLASDGPRVIDFGIARATDATALTGTDVRLGTPAYMAPEQVTGAVAGPEIDVFALGMVAHFAATGGHPFGEGDGHAILYRIVSQEPQLTNCPAPLRDLVRACLAKDPRARPSPAAVVEMCRSRGDASFERRTGWWLPEAVAAEVTRVEGSVPPVPERASEQASERVPERVPTQLDRPVPRTKAVRRPGLVIAAAALAALIVGGGSAFLVTQLPGDGDSGSSGGESGGGSGDGDNAPDRPKQQGNWKLTADQRRLVIRPPAKEGDPFAGCTSAPSTFVDLDKLTVTTDSNHGNFAADGQTLEYMNCGKDGAAAGSGLKLLDGEGVLGKVTDRNIAPAGCRTAARGADLPNPVTVKQIQNDAVLKPGMGLCVETEQRKLVLLWIDRVDKHPRNHDLRTYVTTATQWQPTGT